MRISLPAMLALAAAACAGTDTPAAGASAPDTAASASPPAERLASPRDSASATIGGATVTVDYGRPSRRGRKIFGGLVPFGEVWRTGANAATTLTVSAPVELGGRPLEAGTYTLYSLPSPDGWTLIVNGQTGQWGTEYDEGRDVIRVPLTVSTSASVDTFRIAIDGGASEGRIVLAWDTLQGVASLRSR